MNEEMLRELQEKLEQIKSMDNIEDLGNPNVIIDYRGTDQEASYDAENIENETLRNAGVVASSTERVAHNSQREYTNDLEGELLHEFDSTRDITRREELAEQIKGIRETKKAEQKANLVAEIEQRTTETNENIEEKRQQIQETVISKRAELQATIANKQGKISELEEKIATLNQEENEFVAPIKLKEDIMKLIENASPSTLEQDTVYRAANTEKAELIRKRAVKRGQITKNTKEIQKIKEEIVVLSENYNELENMDNVRAMYPEVAQMFLDIEYLNQVKTELENMMIELDGDRYLEEKYGGEDARISKEGAKYKEEARNKAGAELTGILAEELRRRQEKEIQEDVSQESELMEEEQQAVTLNETKLQQNGEPQEVTSNEDELQQNEENEKEVDYTELSEEDRKAADEYFNEIEEKEKRELDALYGPEDSRRAKEGAKFREEAVRNKNVKPTNDLAEKVKMRQEEMVAKAEEINKQQQAQKGKDNIQSGQTTKQTIKDTALYKVSEVKFEIKEGNEPCYTVVLINKQNNEAKEVSYSGYDMIKFVDSNKAQKLQMEEGIFNAEKYYDLGLANALTITDEGYILTRDKQTDEIISGREEEGYAKYIQLMATKESLLHDRKNMLKISYDFSGLKGKIENSSNREKINRLRKLAKANHKVGIGVADYKDISLLDRINGFFSSIKDKIKGLRTEKADRLIEAPKTIGATRPVKNDISEAIPTKDFTPKSTEAREKYKEQFKKRDRMQQIINGWYTVQNMQPMSMEEYVKRYSLGELEEEILREEVERTSKNEEALRKKREALGVDVPDEVRQGVSTTAKTTTDTQGKVAHESAKEEQENTPMQDLGRGA